jgi:hypothetical protein
MQPVTIINVAKAIRTGETHTGRYEHFFRVEIPGNPQCKKVRDVMNELTARFADVELCTVMGPPTPEWFITYATRIDK